MIIMIETGAVPHNFKQIKPSLHKTAILDGRMNFPLCLAPMVGLSHAPLRQVIRDYMPKDVVTIWPTEMLNSRKLPIENFKLVPETAKLDFETHLVPQILGNDEKYIAPSVAKLIDWGAEGIDINMGCPVQKALKHNYGVALMGDPAYAAEVVRITVKNSSVPVSVKLRAGHQNDISFLLNFVEGLVSAGASWITIHPRTAEQKRRGSADWEQIKILKQKFNIPIIGNGDVQTVDDVIQMMAQTGCDAAMSGRAFAARPWLMWQVAEKLGWPNPEGKIGRAPQTPQEEAKEYGRSLQRLLQLLLQFYPQELALRKFRFHVRTTGVWLDFGHALFSLTTKAKTATEISDEMFLFFEKELSFFERTELRQ
jgi:tRNA-dihydrouridine synthase B